MDLPLIMPKTTLQNKNEFNGNLIIENVIYLIVNVEKIA